MKVGDYVRFDYHRVTVPIQIARITEVHYDITDEDDNVCYSTDVGLVIDESNLVKEPSPNIMDLILPMDLMYIDISPDNCGGIVVPRIPETYCELEQIINEIKLGNYVLKGIVTKEQLMEKMYKVESEVN
ncbi:MAG: hypothetical protein GX638_02325 [Crenarchaeota archaeon]|nr:hypothetical protein [Thermoproteota archaeon]